MRRAVREQPVQDQAEDGEEEHDDTPEQLVRRRAVGFQHLDCKIARLAGSLHPPSRFKEARPRTEDDDVEDKNDEADNSTATAVSPGVAVVACAQSLLGHREGEEREEGEEGGEGELEEHVVVCFEREKKQL